MKVTSYFKQSPRKREREDAHFLNHECSMYGVMDGVTPLDDYRNKEGHNGAYIAANLFKHYFEQSQQPIELVSGIIEVNRKLKQEMEHQKLDLSVKHKLWSTCIVAVRIQAETIQYAQLGDCMLVARYRDASISVITENRVSGVLERAKVRRDRERALGLDIPDESSFASIEKQWAYQRAMANSPDGYGVANGMEEVKDHIQSGFIQIADVSHLLLISDGLFYPGKSLQESYQMILDEGFEQYVLMVEEAERIRGRSPDDRTGILLNLIE